MQRLPRLLALASTLLVGGCLTQIPIVSVDPSQIPDQPVLFDHAAEPEALRSIRRIALLPIPAPSRFHFGARSAEFGSVAGVFPPAAALPAAAGETVRAGSGFGAVAAERLTAQLQARGYAVALVPVRRRLPYRLIDAYESLEPVDADAFLDVVPVAVGFKRKTWAGPFATEVGPHLSFAVRLVSRQSRRILLATTAQYGHGANPLVDGVRVESPAAQVFEDVDAWQADRRRGGEWLMAGLDSIMAAIAGRIAAPPTDPPAAR